MLFRSKVSMTRLILDQSLLGLAESKACTDRLLDGGTVEITMLTRDAAEILASDLNSINAIAHVEDG
mgnify:CR=1 FL=1